MIMIAIMFVGCLLFLWAVDAEAKRKQK